MSDFSSEADGPRLRDTSFLDDFERQDYTKMWDDKHLVDLAQKEVIRSWLAPGGNCLELGGGFGRITKVLEPFFDRVTMIDLVRRNLSEAKSRLGRADILRSDIGRIPARDSSMDCVVMVRVVHLLPDPTSVMREVQRVAKNGATVIMSIPNMPVNYVLRRLDEILFPGLHKAFPTFGPPVWPLQGTPYLSPQRAFIPATFRLEERRGTGLFDNYVGRLLNDLTFLSLVDVATSSLWLMKTDVFFKFVVDKGHAR